MDNIAVIYWSQTGNTKAMADAVLEGAEAGGTKVHLYQVSEISVAQAAEYDKLALGCPAMGDEVLGEDEFEPFFTGLESKLAGKKVALFGSFGWGDGQWMRDWQDRVNSAGAQLFEEGLILNETPDDAGLEACKQLGKRFATF
jgi:flavodoxin I